MSTTAIPRKYGQVRIVRPTFLNLILTFVLVLSLMHIRTSRVPGLTLELPAVPQAAAAVHALANSQAIAARARRTRALPSCAVERKRAKSFLLVFMGHSGSSAILSELRQHPDLHVEKMELVDHQDEFNSSEAASTTRAFFERGIAMGKVPGFKIRPIHLLNEPERFRHVIRQYETRIIWQYRQNIFKASVGEYSIRYLHDKLAVEGLRRNLSKSDRCARGIGCSFPIDNVPFLYRTMRDKVRSHHLISKAVHVVAGQEGCIREVPYEDYLYNRNETMKDIFSFLGVAVMPTIPQRFKATGDNMCEVVENWDEVCRLFYGCIAWQHMLDDPLNHCFCNIPGGPATYCDIQKS